MMMDRRNLYLEHVKEVSLSLYVAVASDYDDDEYDDVDDVVDDDAVMKMMMMMAVRNITMI